MANLERAPREIKKIEDQTRLEIRRNKEKNGVTYRAYDPQVSEYFTLLTPSGDLSADSEKLLSIKNGSDPTYNHANLLRAGNRLQERNFLDEDGQIAVQYPDIVYDTLEQFQGERPRHDGPDYHENCADEEEIVSILEDSNKSWLKSSAILVDANADKRELKGLVEVWVEEENLDQNELFFNPDRNDSYVLKLDYLEEQGIIER